MALDGNINLNQLFMDFLVAGKFEIYQKTESC